MVANDSLKLLLRSNFDRIIFAPKLCSSRKDLITNSIVFVSFNFGELLGLRDKFFEPSIPDFK